MDFPLGLLLNRGKNILEIDLILNSKSKPVDILSPFANKILSVFLLVKSTIGQKSTANQSLSIYSQKSLWQFLFLFSPTNFLNLKAFQKLFTFFDLFVHFLDFCFELVVFLCQLVKLSFVLLKFEVDFLELTLVGLLFVLKNLSLVFKGFDLVG